MSEPTVLNCLQDGVLVITLNRPAVLNALDFPMTEALVQAIQTGKDEDAVRVVMISGAGQGFCAGGDMKHSGSTFNGEAAPTIIFAI